MLWREAARLPQKNHGRTDLRGGLQALKYQRSHAVAGCGAQPFLRLYEDFRFDRTAPLRDPAVVLFDRAPAAPQRLTKRRFATHRLSRRARLFAISPNHELIFRPTVFK